MSETLMSTIYRELHRTDAVDSKQDLLGEMGWGTRDIADVLGITEQSARTYIKVTRQGLNFAIQKYGGL